MSGASIVINQAGHPAGLPSTSREDLELGVLVTLTNNDDVGVLSWTWSFIDIPGGSAAVMLNPGTATASFTPDIEGTYLFRLVVVDGTGSHTDERFAAVDFANGWRIQAAFERTQGGARGWAPANETIIRDIVAGRGFTPIEVAEEAADPAVVPNAAMLYAKEVAGVTRLFTRASDGLVSQLGAAGFQGLQEAYDIGRTVTLGAGPIVLTQAGAAYALEAVSTRNAATGLELSLFHDRAAPADYDDLVTLHFFGNDNLLAKSEYAQLVVRTLETESGRETGSVALRVAREENGAGAIVDALTINTSGLVVSGYTNNTPDPASGPSITWIYDKGGAGIDGEVSAMDWFFAPNAASATTAVATVAVALATAGAGSEAGEFIFSVANNGVLSLAEALRFRRGGIRIPESTSRPIATTAGFGTYWVKNDVPSTPYFTDDTNVDHQLAYAGVATTLQQAYDAGNTIVTDATGRVEIIRGALTIDADYGLYLHDDNANAGRTGALFLIADDNVSDGLYTSSTIRALNSKSQHLLSLEYSALGSSGPVVELFHSKANSGNADDVLGTVAGFGRDVTAGVTRLQYAAIKFVIEDSTAGSADGKVDIYCMRLSDDSRRAVEIKGRVDGVGESGVIFQSRMTTASATTAVSAFTFRVTPDYLAGDAVFGIEDNGGTQLMRVEGDGSMTVSTRTTSATFWVSADGAVGAPAMSSTNSGGTTGLWYPSSTSIAFSLGSVESTRVAEGVTTLTTTTVGATGQELKFSHAKAQVGSAGDAVGIVSFYGPDNNGAFNSTHYADIKGVINSPADTAESGRIEFHAITGGTFGRFLRIRGANVAAEQGAIFQSDIVAGLGVAAFGFDAGIDFAAAQPVFYVRDNVNTAAATLFSVDGVGAISVGSAGTAANPAIIRTGDSNTGIYWSGDDEVGISAAGAVAATFAVGTTALYYLNNAATGPTLALRHLRSTDAQIGDEAGKIQFWCYDDGTPTATQYAEILGRAVAVTDTAEDGGIVFKTMHNGSLVENYSFLDSSWSLQALTADSSMVLSMTNTGLEFSKQNPDDANAGPVFTLYRLRDVDAADADLIGCIRFDGMDDGTPSRVTYAEIQAGITDSATAAPDGGIWMSINVGGVMTHMFEALSLTQPRIGFFGVTPVAQQTAPTPTAAELKAGLVALGLFV